MDFAPVAAAPYDFRGYVRPDDPRDSVARASGVPTRGRHLAQSAGEGVVAPRSGPRPHLQGFRPLEVNHPPQRTLCSALPATPQPGSTVRLQGWVHRRRELAAVTFLVVRDRSGLAQVVVREGDVPPEETTVDVVGTATANAQAPGGVEVTDPVITLLDRAGGHAAGRAVAARAQRRPADACSTTRRSPGGTRRSGRSGSWRPRPCAASARPSTRPGFTEIQTPKFVASATESGANVFEVDYFGRPAYLAQSPQFYKQQLVGVFERVYEVGPVFRAEPHDTVRHLAEYVSLDVELGFIEDHRDVLARAARRAGRDGRRASTSTPRRPSSDRRRGARGPRRDPGPALPRRPGPGRRARGRAGPRARARARARRLGAGRARQRLRRRGGLPDGEAAVLHPPAARRRRAGRTASTCSSAGWSWSPAASGCTGTSDYDAAHPGPRARTRRRTRRTSQAFEHGMPPHGGFAIGLERWTSRLTGAPTSGRSTLFPRDLNRLTP